jgi:hypothetical protein
VCAELLLFEAPLALCKPDFKFDGAFPSSGDEVRDQAWGLTHQLLAAGRRGEWARQEYVVEAKGAEVESPAAVTWLAAKFSCSAEDVLDVFRAVGNNAFSLDTAVMRIKYGAAFFAQAAYLNHSCDPNCVSRRMGALPRAVSAVRAGRIGAARALRLTHAPRAGGNMAVYSLKPGLEPGTEVTHSYIATELLAAPVETRAVRPPTCTRARARARALPRPRPHAAPRAPPGAPALCLRVRAVPARAGAKCRWGAAAADPTQLSARARGVARGPHRYSVQARAALDGRGRGALRGRRGGCAHRG